MTPVFQTRTGTKDGNCFAACVATILDLSLTIIDPLIPVDDRRDWTNQLELWLSERGMRMIYIHLIDGVLNIGTLWPLTVIAGGKAPISGCPHAVVGRLDQDGFHLIHDPHPNQLGISTLDYVWIIAKAL